MSTAIVTEGATGICPQCKTATVIRRRKVGALPRCAGCLEKNRIRRNAGMQRRRKAGLANSHRDRHGRRYPDKAIQKTKRCSFCGDWFVTTEKAKKKKPACESCMAERAEEKRKVSLERVKALYWKDPEIAKRKRLTRTLKSMGLSIEWYDAQPKSCQICGTENPGIKGWQIDHDHRCCPYGIRAGCRNCVRGLLCHKCNRGLGSFGDSIKTLRAAVRYLSRSFILNRGVQ